MKTSVVIEMTIDEKRTLKRSLEDAMNAMRSEVKRMEKGRYDLFLRRDPEVQGSNLITKSVDSNTKGFQTK